MPIYQNIHINNNPPAIFLATLIKHQTQNTRFTTSERLSAFSDILSKKHST